MNAKRLYFGLVASLVLLFVGLIGATLITSNLLKTKSLDLATKKAQVAELTTAQNGIARSKHDIATYSQLADITKSIVPQDKNQAATVREITNIASANNVTLTTITFPSSTLGSSATGKAAAPAATTKPNLSQLTPVPNIPGVYSLQITLGNNSSNPVTFARLNAFLQGLENNRRTAAVSSINIQPQNNNPNNLVFTLIINTYIKP